MPDGRKHGRLFRQAKDVWAEDETAVDARAAFQKEMIFPIGEPNTAYAPYFTGRSYIARISDSQIPFSNVTFEPRCAITGISIGYKGGGQMLVGLAGRGWYQEEGNLLRRYFRARSSTFRLM